MSALAIQADFPLGTFLGHQDVGRVAHFPDIARLHSALLHAASKGTQAIERNGDLRASPESLSALRWLETHPPARLAMPQIVRANHRSAGAWRREGVFDARKDSVSERRILKSQSDSMAVGGPVQWVWEDVPEEVRRTLELVAADVSCLGETESVVVLRVVDESEVRPTHDIADEQSGFPEPGMLLNRAPITGRVDELETAYEQANPGKSPTIAGDRFSMSQRPGLQSPSSARVRSLSYVPREIPAVTPWQTVVIVDVPIQPDKPASRDSLLDLRNSVRWSVAFHRALAANIGDEAPPLVTGRYLRGAKQPANRIAIQVLRKSPLLMPGVEDVAFALMIPEGTEPTELAVLHRALSNMKHVRARINGCAHSVQLGGISVARADEIWHQPAAGMRRFWRPLPALVPEVRRQRTRERSWTLSHAAQLAIGHVFRDQLWPGGDLPSMEERVEEVRRHGVHVHDVHLIRDSDVSKYAHNVPAGITVQPFTALIDLGQLASATSVLALGQSRHLGGGLLHPEDIATYVADARGF